MGQKIGEDQIKKRSSLQNELVFSSKVCDDQKKKVFAYQSVGFRSQKKKQPTVSPQNGDTRGGPPLATPLIPKTHNKNHVIEVFVS